MNKNVIELKGITVRKARSLLLDGISLGVSRNEFIGIIGPNGAGKTTLLNVIAGFERFEGTLSLFGRREAWTRSRETRLRVGYVPQLFQIDPAFPILALEAVMTGAIGRLGLFRSVGRPEREKAMRLMEMMRVAHLADRPMGQLSGGERQKVSLARAILQEPDILLMDEPTANLDIAIQKEVLNLIDEIHKQEILTLLLVTHDFNMLPAGMRRAVLLNRGRKVFDGNINTALSGETLSRLFEYPLETFERNGRRFVSYG
ncbi:MAG TPA: metal ABC transporter ATP-binding protein [Thermodesulfobacteriota bacterium]|nr:metal ABC transporter ATP-binding protein [Thermodesulfobacteriota bacterium]HVP77800.1 metal ABC transporter ATP-binding protein [Thermodesulfobacteriota bacterium]